MFDMVVYMNEHSDTDNSNGWEFSEKYTNKSYQNCPISRWLAYTN